MIRLAQIRKTYRSGEVEIPVLRGIDLEIAQGERVAIMGRSGSGKSTLMHILGLLDRATSGAYELGGRDVGALGDDELSRLRGRTIGFVFQAFHLLKNRDIVDNVALPLEYQDVPKGERRARATALLERVGLGHRLAHRPTQLSGGERQRVAIARALVTRPRILMADEPTGNLDSAAQADIMALFDELHAETGVTLIVVTHDRAIGEASPRRIELLDGAIAPRSGRREGEP
jgi:putative ABC transport system ATP-binding protein